MKLIDAVNEIDSIDQDAVIFQKDLKDATSDVLISFVEEGDEGIKQTAGIQYYYLIEVVLAKEFIDDFKNSLNNDATSQQVANRLYKYAINDA